MNLADMVSYIEINKEAILIIAGIFSFIIYLFGKIIKEESPFYSSNAKENDFLTGISFFIRLLYAPAALILFLKFIFQIYLLLTGGHVLAAFPDFFNENWPLISDLACLFILSTVLLQLTKSELNEHLTRLNFFEKHEEYEKRIKQNNNQVQIWSYWWAPLSLVIFSLLCYLHTLASFGVFDAISIFVNGSATIFILLMTAMIHGQYHPKPKIFIYTTSEKAPVEAFFIRWENDCIRVVPRDASSLLVPKSNIVKISYPKVEDEKPKEPLGFMAKVSKIRICIENCISEVNQILRR